MVRDRTRMLALQKPPDIPRSIAVIGCGGIGTWVAIIGAMAGTNHFRLFDGDNLDASNLARLPYTPAVVGRPKSEVLRDFLQALDPDIIAAAFPPFEPGAEQFLEDGDVVFICTDNANSRNFSIRACKERKLRYVNGAYDGNHITVTPYPIHDFRPRDGYQVDPSWAAPTAIIASVMWYAAGYQLDDLRLTMDILERLDATRRARNRGQGAGRKAEKGP